MQYLYSSGFGFGCRLPALSGYSNVYRRLPCCIDGLLQEYIGTLCLFTQEIRMASSLIDCTSKLQLSTLNGHRLTVSIYEPQSYLRVAFILSQSNAARLYLLLHSTVAPPHQIFGYCTLLTIRYRYRIAHGWPLTMEAAR